ncbi:MAG: YCF48-related protein [bacterium]
MKQTHFTFFIVILLFNFCILISSFPGCGTNQKAFSIRLDWESQTSDVNASLRGLCAVSEKIAWASGSQGTILRTTDGGATWEKRPVPEDASALDFRDIQAFNENRAVISSAGQPARIYKTYNGGEHWRLVYTTEIPGVFLDAMAFWDEKNGIAFSDPVEDGFFLIRTTDAGDSWQRIPSEKIPRPLEGEAGFAASGTCIAVQGKNNAWFGTGGSLARLFRSTNRGETWFSYATPILSGQPSTGIFSLTFFDEKNGSAVGGNYLTPDSTQQNSSFTTDGGISWLPVDGSPPSGYRSCVAIIPGTKPPALLTVGPNGSDISTDGGKTWTQADTIGYHVVSFPKKGNVGWAAGSGGRIAKCVISTKKL